MHKASKVASADELVVLNAFIRKHLFPLTPNPLQSCRSALQATAHWLTPSSPGDTFLLLWILPPTLYCRMQ